MKLSWKLATTYTDGSAFGQADYAGVEISVDGAAAVALPAAWNPDNAYEFELASLQMSDGAHKVKMRVIAKNGQVSDYTAELAFTHKKKPLPPVLGGVA